MVSPEQCATAPKVSSKDLTPLHAKSSPTRLVLLAVLALAAATGAMFGVVVFGNEFTKDVHPQDGSHMNSVTLVDSNDRAIATADVESYVTLLDLPLLGTAELNKVDGITFSTHKGLEHRKVTGYTITKETATVGDSVVEAPHLSFRSEPGITIEVSVQKASAWIEEVNAHGTVRTAIDVAPSRRGLSDNLGSCLANGACLYSRDELLQVDSETRKLSEGGFFARADIAAFQVDLNGEDVLNFLDGKKNDASYFEGSWDEDGHSMMMRIELKSDHLPTVFVHNATDKSAKVMGSNGTFVFLDDELVTCDTQDIGTLKMLSNIDLEVVPSLGFDEVTVVHGDVISGFIPLSGHSFQSCVDFQVAHGNLSGPEFYEDFYGRPMTKDSLEGGNIPRKLAYQNMRPLTHEERTERHHAEMLSYMQDMSNTRNQEILQSQALLKEEHKRRRLEDWGWGSFSYSYAYEWDDSAKYTTMNTVVSHSDVSSTTMRPSTSYITHFDLWLCTRLADPSFIHEGYADFNDGTETATGGSGAILGLSFPSSANIANGAYHAPSYTLNLAGGKGISSAFKYWSGIHHNGAKYLPDGFVAELQSWSTAKTTTGATGVYDAESTQPSGAWTADQMSIAASSSFYHAMFPGSCSGGYEMDTGEGLVDLAFELADTQLGGVPRQFGVQMCEMIADDVKEKETDSSKEVRDPFADYGDTGYLAAFMNTVCKQYIDEKELTVGPIQMRLMNTWASYMYKETFDSSGSSNGKEYIVAFQGTKGTDLSMFQYNTRQNPMFTFIGEEAFIIPNGYFDYMVSLVYCLDNQIDQTYKNSNDEWQSTTPAFITGHSLGGGAATLYAASRPSWGGGGNTNGIGTTYPRLVTFGAGPTQYTGSSPDDGTWIACASKELTSDSDKATANDVSDYCYTVNDASDPQHNGKSFMSSAGFKKYSQDMSGLGNFCSKANPQSIRFIHKFDPIGAIANFKGMYGHSTEHTIMVMDAHDTSCAGTEASCEISSAELQTGKGYADLGLHGSNPDNVKVWGCTKHKVKPCTWASKCTDYYSSYYSLGTNNPCAQMQAQRQMEYFIQTEEGQEMYEDVKKYFGGAEKAGLKVNDWSENGFDQVFTTPMLNWLFKEHEGFASCVGDWHATTSNWLNAALHDTHGIVWGLIPFFFGFTWVHSTYGFYPLCTSTDSSGNIVNVCPGRTDANLLHSCTQAQMTALAQFCFRGGYKEDGLCIYNGIDNNCMAKCDWENEKDTSLYKNGDSSVGNAVYPQGFKVYCESQQNPTPAPVWSGSGSGV